MEQLPHLGAVEPTVREPAPGPFVLPKDPSRDTLPLGADVDMELGGNASLGDPDAGLEEDLVEFGAGIRMPALAAGPCVRTRTR